MIIPAVHAMEQATKLEQGVQTGLWQMGEPIALKTHQMSRVVILNVQVLMQFIVSRIICDSPSQTGVYFLYIESSTIRDYRADCM